MNCLVVYQSKSGYTRRYMEMLSEALAIECIEMKSLNTKVFKGYDTFVYAGGIYAGKVSGVKKFAKLLANHTPTRWVVIGVGASPSSEELKLKLIEDNLNEPSILQLGNPEFFYLQGGFDPEKLNFALKSILGVVSNNLGKKQAKYPESLTEEDQAFLSFFQTANDQTSVEQLQPIIEFLENVKKEQ